jgi:hypothetical protein
VRFSLSRRRRNRLKYPASPLFEFRLRLEPSPAGPSPSAAAGQAPLLGFRSLQHIKGLKVHFPRALPARYVPPSGFGYPLDGFLPSNPCRFCFTPTALMGFTLRSLPLSKSSRAFPLARTHLPFLLAFLPPPKRWAGPQGRGSWVSTSQESLANEHVVSAPPAGYSPGFRPSRACRWKPCPGSPPNSSHALPGASDRSLATACASEYQSAPTWFHPRRHTEAQRADRTALLGFSHRSFPQHANRLASGLWVHLATRRALLPTDRRSLEATSILPELSGTD